MWRKVWRKCLRDAVGIPTDKAFGKRMSVAVRVVRKKDAAGGRNTTSQFNINQFLFVKYGNRKNVTQGIPPLP